MTQRILLVLPLLLLLACSPDNEKSKAEIKVAERDFAAMAKSKGVPAAFLAFAAPDAVMHRGEKLVQGHDEMQRYFEQQPLREVKLDWSPDFVDASGDLGYTYGRYTFSARDSTGNPVEAKGIFHTVWKRQPDGSWKFVWD